MREPHLTEAAKSRLASHLNRLGNEITEAASRSSFIPGEDSVEVTASDVERVAREVRVRPRDRSELRTLVYMTYAVVGALGTIGGLFYDRIKTVLEASPPQAVITISSALIGVMSLLMLLRERVRSRRYVGLYWTTTTVHRGDDADSDTPRSRPET